MKRYKFKSGWQPEPLRNFNINYSETFDIQAFDPSPIDLRYNDIKIFNQGSLNSCTCHALAAAHQIVQNQKNIDVIEPSRLFLHYNSHRIAGHVGTKAPVPISTAFDSLKTFGACTEEDWRYIISNHAIEPPGECYTEALDHQSKKHKTIRQDISELTNSLRSGQPFVFGFFVYESYTSDDVENTGIVPLPDTTKEKVVDEHAVVAVGYNNGYVIFQNSRGDSWGQDGFGFMPREFITNPALAMNFCALIDVKP